MTAPRLTDNQRMALSRVRRLGASTSDGWVQAKRIGQRASVIRLIEKGMLEVDDRSRPAWVRVTDVEGSESDQNPHKAAPGAGPSTTSGSTGIRPAELLQYPL